MNPIILITVEGGNIQDIEVSGGPVDVYVIDRDNLEAGQEVTALLDCYPTSPVKDGAIIETILSVMAEEKARREKWA